MAWAKFSFSSSIIPRKIMIVPEQLFVRCHPSTEALSLTATSWAFLMDFHPQIRQPLIVQDISLIPDVFIREHAGPGFVQLPHGSFRIDRNLVHLISQIERQSLAHRSCPNFSANSMKQRTPPFSLLRTCPGEYIRL